jgi:heterotetrameric sarcosine oxidase gamma subunit
VPEPVPVARGPVRPVSPVVVSGWEVEGAAAVQSGAPLTLTDVSALAKTLVRAPAAGAMASALGVPFARAARDAHGALVTGSGPGEWTVIGAIGEGLPQRSRLEAVAAGTGGEFITVLDMTHGRALIRLTGPSSAALLAKVCAIDLADHVTPDGTALRTSVAKLTTDLVRDDQADIPSYLLHCERSFGQYLFEALKDAGAEFAIEVGAFPAAGR